MLRFGQIRVIRPIQRTHRPENLPLIALPKQLGVRFEYKRRPCLLGWRKAFALHHQHFE